MKLYVFLFLVLLSHYSLGAESCVRFDDAKLTLQTILTTGNGVDHPEAMFDEDELLSGLKFIDKGEDQYYSETEFFIEGDKSLCGEYGCPSSFQGTLIFLMSCDGRYDLIFSFDHD